jgi:hypothetical protein
MRIDPKRSLLIASLFGLGLGIAAPTFAQAQDRTGANDRTIKKNVERATARGEDFEAPVNLDQVPSRVRKEIDRARGNEKIVTVYKIQRSGKEYYRATVSNKKSDRVILVTGEGVTQNVEDIRPAELADYRADPNTWYRDYDERMLAQERHYTSHADTVTATVDNPERVNWDQVPGRVRSTFTREANGEKVDYIIRYRDKAGNVIYQTNVPDGRNQQHLLQVRPDGSLFDEGFYKNDTGSRATADDLRPQTIGLADVPARVRDTVDQEAPRGRVPRVEVATRGGRKLYTVEVAQSGGTRYLTIDEKGKVISDVSDKYDNTARPANDRNR